MRRGVARLRRKPKRLGGEVGVIRDEHAAGRGGDDLVAVEREDAGLAERAGGTSLVIRPDGLRRVLDNDDAVPRANRADRIHVGGLSIQVYGNNGLGDFPERGALLQKFGEKSGSMFQVASSESMNTGLAPCIRTGEAEAIKVSEEQITSSPAPIPAMRSARCKAAVPDDTATACLTPSLAANSRSKASMFAPTGAIQFESNASSTCRRSLPRRSGGESQILGNDMG